MYNLSLQLPFESGEFRFRGHSVGVTPRGVVWTVRGLRPGGGSVLSYSGAGPPGAAPDRLRARGWRTWDPHCPAASGRPARGGCRGCSSLENLVGRVGIWFPRRFSGAAQGALRPGVKERSLFHADSRGSALPGPALEREEHLPRRLAVLRPARPPSCGLLLSP